MSTSSCWFPGSAARGGLLGLAFTMIISVSASGIQERSAQSVPARRTLYDDLQLFSQVLNQIRVNHADSVDVHTLFVAAIQGMVREVDPHSFVMVAEREMTRREGQLREGKLHPVPLDFEFVGGAPLVVNVTPGSRAASQDIIPGDELVTIDGKPVRSAGEGELEIELAGPPGSTALLGLDRHRPEGSIAHLERKVERQRMEEVSAVAAPTLLDRKTGYLRILSFLSDRVADDVRSAMGTLEREGMERLVLDLRDNSGGSVGQAATVAGEFLPGGTVIYTSEGRKPDAIDTARVKRAFLRTEKRYPMVVLVNGGTASAAELLAAALQDHDRAMLVGGPTFGKSLIMRPLPLVDGSVILLVTGRVRTPCGRLIQRPYRDLTTREYYRMAGAARDTVGLPSCRTRSGRVVYGGRGIYPDVALSDTTVQPPWLSLLVEQDLPLQWVGGYVAEHRAQLGTLETFEQSPRLPTDPALDFRSFVSRHGVDIPRTPEADDWLRGVVFAYMARAAFGTDGWYRIRARHDPTVQAAVGALDEAANLVR